VPETRSPAERRYQVEIDALIAADGEPRPPGWAMSPMSAVTYVLGSPEPVRGVPITPKYIGNRYLVEIAVATLASDRALLLAGEPGTAKSWLSEHLTAAISGTSALIVQGSAGTSEEHLKYGWNYALLLAEGPTERALVPSPVLRAMREGKIARVEEITRTSPEVQDALISILSEKQIAIPELGTIVSAERGFNIVATANTRDRGVNEMSAALKRRFNFVVVPVVSDLEQEIRIVVKRAEELRNDYQVGAPAPEALARMLVTMFQELRAGMTKDGKTKVKSPGAVLSTAEAISVLFQSGILAKSFRSGAVSPTDVAHALVGAVAKESADDHKTVREYLETVAKVRSGEWKAFAKAATTALEMGT
jgi:MoxR-like ATPase